MDTVRFGRALGFGARQAAKTVVAAVDAATAPAPSETSRGSRTRDGMLSSPEPAVARQRPPLARSSAKDGAAPVASRQPKTAGVLQGSKRFRQAAFSPVVRLSGVLVLEVAGVFFGIFALYGLSTLLRFHSDWRSGMPHHREWLGGLGMLAVFGYFCVSSFVRAKRREKAR